VLAPMLRDFKLLIAWLITPKQNAILGTLTLKAAKVSCADVAKRSVGPHQLMALFLFFVDSAAER
jgi:hypothetical protein